MFAEKKLLIYIWLNYTSNLLSQFIVSEKGVKRTSRRIKVEDNETGSETSPNT